MCVKAKGVHEHTNRRRRRKINELLIQNDKFIPFFHIIIKHDRNEDNDAVDAYDDCFTCTKEWHDDERLRLDVVNCVI